MAMTAAGLYSERARSMFGMSAPTIATSTTSPTEVISRGMGEQSEVMAKVASYSREQVLLLKQQIRLLTDIRKSQSSWSIGDALITKMIMGAGGKLFGSIGRVGGLVGGAIAGAGGLATGLFKTITSGIGEGVKTLGTFIRSGVSGIFTSITGFFTNVFETIPKFVSSVGRPIMKVINSLTTLNIGSLFGGMSGLFHSAGKIVGIIGRIGSKFLLPLTALFTAFDLFKGFTNADEILGREGVGIVGKIGSAISTAVNGLLLGIPDWISDKLGFKSFAQMVDAGGLKISEYTGKIVDVVGKMFGTVSDYVVNFVGSLTGAIGEAWEAAKAYVSSIGTWIKDSIKSAFGFGNAPERPVFDAPRQPPVLPGTTTTGPTLNFGGGLAATTPTGPSNMVTTPASPESPKPVVPSAPIVDPGTTAALNDLSTASRLASEPSLTQSLTDLAKAGINRAAEVSSDVVSATPTAIAIAAGTKQTSSVANNAIAKTNAVAMSAIEAQEIAVKQIEKNAKDSTKAIAASANATSANVFDKIMGGEAFDKLKDVFKDLEKAGEGLVDYYGNIAKDMGSASKAALGIVNGTMPTGAGGFTGNGVGYSGLPAFSGGASGVQSASGRPAATGTSTGGVAGADLSSIQATGPNDYLAQVRKKSFDEMEADPTLKSMALAMSMSENGGHAEGPLESLVNRAAIDGKSIREHLYGGFYGPINRGEVSPLAVGSKKYATALAAYERVRAGSNDIDLRTDQGMVNEHKWADSVANQGRGRKANIRGEYYSDKSAYYEQGSKRIREGMEKAGVQKQDNWNNAFNPQTSDLGSNVKQPNIGSSGTIRNQAIDKDVLTALDYAAKQNGVFAEVVSGGQDGIGEGGRRTGSTRHDRGGSADTKFYTIDSQGNKQYVDFSTKEGQAKMQAIAASAASAGMTGLGAGASYMGTQTMHIGKGKQAVWGGIRGERVPEWLQQGAAQGWANQQDMKAWRESQGKPANIATPEQGYSDGMKASAFSDPWNRGLFARTPAGVTGPSPSVRDTFFGTAKAAVPDYTKEVGRAIGEGMADIVMERPTPPSFTPVSPTTPMQTGSAPVTGSMQTQNPGGESSSAVASAPSPRDIPSIDEYSMLLINGANMA